MVLIRRGDVDNIHFWIGGQRFVRCVVRRDGKFLGEGFSVGISSRSYCRDVAAGYQQPVVMVFMDSRNVKNMARAFRFANSQN